MSKTRRARASEAPRDEQEERRQEAEHEAGAEEFGHTEDAHLGDRRLEDGEQDRADGKLDEIGDESRCRGRASRRPPAPGPRAGRRRRSATCRAAASAKPANSMTARWRPEYSSTIASWTMVSSRWVAGLSTGMRAVLGDARRGSARPGPGRARRAGPRPVEAKRSAMVDSWVEPATSARVKTIMIIAGSASEAIITSRLRADAAEGWCRHPCRPAPGRSGRCRAAR